jgi:ribosomal protein S18 acetylase RimI-like enzyme
VNQLPSDNMKIIEITGEEMDNSVNIIRRAFGTVAAEFSLTTENCPNHPAFITPEQLSQLRAKGLRFFGIFINNRQVGFVAVEKADDTLYYMEKLAVLPEYRHSGYGRKLMEFVINHVKNKGGETLSLGMIDKHTILKNWYKEIGFREISTKEFEYLPFTVCFMDFEIK